MSIFPYLTPLKPWDEFNFENKDYTVFVNGERVFCYNTFVEMHDVHTAAISTFDVAAPSVITILRKKPFSYADIFPKSKNISFSRKNNELTFTVSPGDKLSIEFDGDKFTNLHLFANMKTDAPLGRQIQPGIHRKEDVFPKEGETIVFLPGLHYIEETMLRLSSFSSVHLCEGACLVGSIVCENIFDVKITGTGVINLMGFHRYSAFRGIKLSDCSRIFISGVTIINPPHYSVYIGSSENIEIDNIKCFSHLGWSDGIDIMASKNIQIKNVFMRNSDDCIAVYASRWTHKGDCKNVTVSDSILWADVAHPMNIGIHSLEGDKIENITFENITVLEAHEPQEDYCGIMSVVAGDGAFVENITFKNISIERATLARLFDIRVTFNETYNSIPGKGIQNVTFENISSCPCSRLPRIECYDSKCRITQIRFENKDLTEE